MKGSALVVCVLLAGAVATAQEVPLATVIPGHGTVPRPTPPTLKRVRRAPGRIPSPLPALPAASPTPEATAAPDPLPSVTPPSTPAPKELRSPVPTPFGSPYGLRQASPTPEIHRPPDTLRTPVMFSTPGVPRPD